MFRHLFRALFDDARRGDDRAPQAPADPTGLHAESSAKPAILPRRTVTLVVILGLGAILYGTVVPFDIDWNRSANWRLGWYPPAPGDTVANVLVYAVIGAFLRLLIRRRGSSRLVECTGTMLLAVGLSYVTEVVQTMVPARVPSWTDVVCNGVGAALGTLWAPTLQHVLRNVHAYLYRKVRHEPFAAAAAATLLCVCTYALAPPDFYPAPGHVGHAIQRLRSVPDTWLGISGVGEAATLGPAQAMDKLMAAGAYGFLAFVLLLSAREAGRSPLASAWYAFSRSAALAMVIEAMQLFTISHTADAGDLVAAWICCQLGAVGGWLLVSLRPETHEHPIAVLRGLVAAVLVVLFAWSAGSIVLAGKPAAPASVSWVPLVNNFDRPWNGLLGDYVEGLLQYGLVAGLVVVAFRSHHRRPQGWVVVGVTVASAVLAATAAVYRHQGFDTAQLALAALAGAGAIRVDRAVFGVRGTATPPAPAGTTDHGAGPPPTGPQGVRDSLGGPFLRRIAAFFRPKAWNRNSRGQRPRWPGIRQSQG